MTPEEVQRAAENLQAGIVAEVLAQAHLAAAELDVSGGLQSIPGFEEAMESAVGLTIGALHQRGLLDSRAVAEALGA